ncbi:adenylate cyclase regulatory domain-containing protein [Nonomuraea sp. NPDC050328]|uniref:adenylate/guanylate cyclase domain-containing protein n=1 Tax=Nonomuraea sp. NPDC050328 TaxID=3364361 RepID=UPI0037A1FD4B
MSRPTAEQIERLFAGQRARHTRAEVAAAAGVSGELAARLWRALGFATLPDDTVAFTDADVDALGVVRTLLDGGLLDAESAIRMARALGQTTARLAQWQAEIVIGAMLPGDGPPSDEELTRVMEAAGRLLPDLEQLLVHVWRAQLGAAGSRLLALADLTDEAAPTRATLAVGFADLVSFTSRARELDERELAELVEGFESRAADVIAGHGARLVKTLGDEVLFTAPTAQVAAAVALDLVGPELRIGLAYGPVVPMMGDVFGTTVNLASRLTGLARPGTVLIDQALARHVAPERTRRLRRRTVAGLGPVQPYLLRS